MGLSKLATRCTNKLTNLEVHEHGRIDSSAQGHVFFARFLAIFGVPFERAKKVQRNKKGLT